MRYSFMSFSCPGLGLEEMLKLAKKLGYEGIEPRIGAGHYHGIETGLGNEKMTKIQWLAEKIGVKICCLATSCSFSDPDNTQENIHRAKQAVDLASGINCQVIRVFGGVIPEAIDRETASGSIADSLAELSGYASQRDVIICLETHDDWCDPGQAARIMDRVDSPNIAVNWDILHPVIKLDYSIEESFSILRPWIKHVHVHDGTRENGELVFKHIGEGDVDHKTAIRLLKQMDYSDYISGEWIGWEPYETHLPRELAILRKYEGSADVQNI